MSRYTKITVRILIRVRVRKFNQISYIVPGLLHPRSQGLFPGRGQRSDTVIDCYHLGYYSVTLRQCGCEMWHGNQGSIRNADRKERSFLFFSRWRPWCPIDKQLRHLWRHRCGMVRNCEVSPFVLRHVFHWRRGTARQWRRLQDYGTNGRRDQREREAPGHRRDRGCDGESATVASCRFVERGSIHQTFIQTKSNVVLRRRRTKLSKTWHGGLVCTRWTTTGSSTTNIGRNGPTSIQET